MDKYVIDTHALVWYITNDKKLSRKAKDILSKAESSEGSGHYSNHCFG
jgi:PIN domain nuclease of toxin-antitoxin system